jgi:hypothetical protein
MQKVSEYTNRSEFSRKMNIKILKNGPLYLLLDDGELMPIYHISKNYFRNCEPEKNENGGILFNSECWKQKIMSDSIIFENKKEVEMFYKIKLAEEIMSNFVELEEKYFKWKQFKKDNPHYFI